MIDSIYYDYNYYKTRMCREKTRKDYLNLDRGKKRTAKKMRRAINNSQPYIRPIVGRKVVEPVEFGTKLNLSIDENVLVRLERLSFDTYNESDVLIGAIERYKERTGHYQKSALLGMIYRNRDNLAYCIVISAFSWSKQNENVQRLIANKRYEKLATC